MNKNISPIKCPSLLLPKQIVSPFKKFIPRNVDQSQQINFCSPVEYIKTAANPEISKNQSQSTHEIHGNNNLSFLQVYPKQKQQKFSFIKQKNHTNGPMPFSCKNPNAETNTHCSHRRKFQYNQVSMGLISPAIRTRKSEIRTNDQNQQCHDFPIPRGRKLSQLVKNSTHSSQFVSKSNYNLTNNNVAFLQQHKINQQHQTNQHNLLRKELYYGHLFEGKTSTHNFYSLKSIPNDPKSPFNFTKQTKFRKNSDGTNVQPKDVKIQVPSFLLKKIQRQSIENISKHEDSIRVSSFYPQKKFSLKDFRVLRQLGQGKFGKVLLVRQQSTGFICAMKVFKKSQLKHDNFIEQFIRQLKIQFYLNHPNIIKMYGYFDDLSYIYVLLEVAVGGTLYQFLQGCQHGERLCKSGDGCRDSKSQRESLTRLGLKETAFIMHQLCSAISYLHLNSIIHRDLKPQNIVIHEKMIKLCDFGWSVFKGTQMRTTFCGTPLYLCPQLITGSHYDEKVDIWAIGIMLYEFVIGPNPFNIKQQGDLVNVIFQDVEMVERGCQQIDSTVIDLIRKCLSKQPLQRLDIRQVINHQFFRRYCPQLMTNNTNIISRHGSLSISQTFKSPTSSQLHY